MSATIDWGNLGRVPRKNLVRLPEEGRDNFLNQQFSRQDSTLSADTDAETLEKLINAFPEDVVVQRLALQRALSRYLPFGELSTGVVESPKVPWTLSKAHRRSITHRSFRDALLTSTTDAKENSPEFIRREQIKMTIMDPTLRNPVPYPSVPSPVWKDYVFETMGDASVVSLPQLALMNDSETVMGHTLTDSLRMANSVFGGPSEVSMDTRHIRAVILYHLGVAESERIAYVDLIDQLAKSEYIPLDDRGTATARGKWDRNKALWKSLRIRNNRVLSQNKCPTGPDGDVIPFNETSPKDWGAVEMVLIMSDTNQSSKGYELGGGVRTGEGRQVGHAITGVFFTGVNSGTHSMWFFDSGRYFEPTASQAYRNEDYYKGSNVFMARLIDAGYLSSNVIAPSGWIIDLWARHDPNDDENSPVARGGRINGFTSVFLMDADPEHKRLRIQQFDSHERICYAQLYNWECGYVGTYLFAVLVRAFMNRRTFSDSYKAYAARAGASKYPEEKFRSVLVDIVWSACMQKADRTGVFTTLGDVKRHPRKILQPGDIPGMYDTLVENVTRFHRNAARFMMARAASGGAWQNKFWKLPVLETLFRRTPGVVWPLRRATDQLWSGIGKITQVIYVTPHDTVVVKQIADLHERITPLAGRNPSVTTGAIVRAMLNNTVRSKSEARKILRRMTKDNRRGFGQAVAGNIIVEMKQTVRLLHGPLGTAEITGKAPEEDRLELSQELMDIEDLTGVPEANEDVWLPGLEEPTTGDACLFLTMKQVELKGRLDGIFPELTTMSYGSRAAIKSRAKQYVLVPDNSPTVDRVGYALRFHRFLGKGSFGAVVQITEEITRKLEETAGIPAVSTMALKIEEGVYGSARLYKEALIGDHLNRTLLQPRVIPNVVKTLISFTCKHRPPDVGSWSGLYDVMGEDWPGRNQRPFGNPSFGVAYTGIEFLPDGVLYDALKERPLMTQDQIRSLAFQLQIMIYCFHEVGFVHRDLKTENMGVQAIRDQSSRPYYRVVFSGGTTVLFDPLNTRFWGDEYLPLMVKAIDFGFGTVGASVEQLREVQGSIEAILGRDLRKAGPPTTEGISELLRSSFLSMGEPISEIKGSFDFWSPSSFYMIPLKTHKGLDGIPYYSPQPIYVSSTDDQFGAWMMIVALIVENSTPVLHILETTHTLVRAPFTEAPDGDIAQAMSIYAAQEMEDLVNTPLWFGKNDPSSSYTLQLFMEELDPGEWRIKIAWHAYAMVELIGFPWHRFDDRSDDPAVRTTPIVMENVLAMSRKPLLAMEDGDVTVFMLHYIWRLATYDPSDTWISAMRWKPPPGTDPGNWMFSERAGRGGLVRNDPRFMDLLGQGGYMMLLKALTWWPQQRTHPEAMLEAGLVSKDDGGTGYFLPLASGSLPEGTNTANQWGFTQGMLDVLQDIVFIDTP